MRVRFWLARPRRYARVEFADGRNSRLLRGVRKIDHAGSFITIRTKDEIYHWHESEVRLVHICSAQVKTVVKKEAPF